LKPKISLITPGVADLDRARADYGEGQDFELHNYRPGDPSIMFKLHGTWLGLYPAEALAEDAQSPSAWPGFPGFTLAHTVGVGLPASVRRAVGLHEAPSWVIVSEHNVDEWPNGGLAPLPGRPGEFSYGFIPPGLFNPVKVRVLELAGQGRSLGVRR
jgi:hypothetical protein